MDRNKLAALAGLNEPGELTNEQLMLAVQCRRNAIRRHAAYVSRNSRTLLKKAVHEMEEFEQQATEAFGDLSEIELATALERSKSHD
jgi:hypothetical protein